MHRLILKKGREKSLLRRHPWIFSGAVERIHGAPGAGDTVEVVTSKEIFLAQAAYSPHSQIVARVWDWNRESRIDSEFFHKRLHRAVAARQTLVRESNAMRLVHSESDGLPGLVIDRYCDTLVMQVLSAGMERWYQTCADFILQLTGTVRVYERSDAEIRQLEGLIP